MLGSIIGGIGSLLGGLFGSSSQEKANEENIKYQREFAQNGIQWRVADANKAGIHPLYALGANTVSFAPSSVGSNALGEGIANASQEIGRAITAQGTKADRAIQATMAKLALQRAGLENELLATQIRKIEAPGTPPALPSPANRYLVDGQGQTLVSGPSSAVSSNLVVDQPLERVTGDPNLLSAEPGAVTDQGWIKTPRGYATVPSMDAKNRIEDSLYELDHYARNGLLPRIGITNGQPPPVDPGPGKSWYLDTLTGEWVARSDRKVKGAPNPYLDPDY